MAPKSVLLPVSDHPRGGGDDDALFKGSAMSKRGAYAALSYMTCAVFLVMFNKAALSSYNFPCANVITLFQIITSTCILYAMKRWKIISFTVGEPWSASDTASLVPVETWLRTLPLSLAYLFYMLASMESVRGVNVPMYTTLRRTTVVFTMIVEYLLTGQNYSSPVVGSVSLIVFGAFVAGARDLSFDAYGYSIVFIANITTAIYLATIARESPVVSIALVSCGAMVIIALPPVLNLGLVCGPILFFWAYIRGDLELTMNFPHRYSPGFQAVMLLSCIMAFFLNYSIFLNTTLNSAVTQTMCGNLKDLFTVGFGWLVFGGLPFDLLNIIGQCLGFVGSGFYAYCKLKGK